MKLISVMEGCADRLWMPHQVGLEFHANRVEHIRNQQALGGRLIEALASFKNAFGKILQDYALNVDVSFLGRNFDEVIETFSGQVRSASEAHLKNYEVTPQSDPILRKLEVLYEGRVGPRPDEEWFAQAHLQAEIRYDRKIPPGYMDAKSKEAPRKYGDYVLWLQIIEYARSTKCDVIFVTDDKKVDWWWDSKGETLGPEPRLRDEFRKETGQQFYAYRSNQFIRLSDERQSVPVDEKVVHEIETSSEAYAGRLHEKDVALEDLIRLRDAVEGARINVANRKGEYNGSLHLADSLMEQLNDIRADTATTRRAIKEVRDRIKKFGELPDDVDRLDLLVRRVNLLTDHLNELEMHDELVNKRVKEAKMELLHAEEVLRDRTALLQERENVTERKWSSLQD